MSTIADALEAELAAIRALAARAAKRALTLHERARAGRHFARLVRLFQQAGDPRSGTSRQADRAFPWPDGLTTGQGGAPIKPGTIDPRQLERLEARLDWRVAKRGPHFLAEALLLPSGSFSRH